MFIVDEKVEDIIGSLTSLNIPRLAVFKRAKEVAITIATQRLFNINSKTVRDLANKFVSIEGRDIIPKGLTVMHYSPNENDDIKDEKQKVRNVMMVFNGRCKHLKVICVDL